MQVDLYIIVWLRPKTVFFYDENSADNWYTIKELCSQSEFNIWAASWENQRSAYAKTKTQISFAVTAKLIRAFVFATRIVQFLYYLNPKFQASSHLQWLYSLVCVRPGQNPHCWFSHVGGSYGKREAMIRNWCNLYQSPAIKPKWEITKITKCQNTKRTCGKLNQQLFPKRWPLSYLNLTKYLIDT